MTIGKMLVPVPNSPRDPWYQKRNHVRLPSRGESKAWLDQAFTETTPPTPTIPSMTSAPVLSGSGVVGDPLSATLGSWSGYPTPTLSRQWQKNGADIPGETGANYTPVTGDIGAVIDCEITASNTEGTVQAYTNSATIAAAPAAPVNTAVPTIAGTAQVGQTLTRTAGTWTGSPVPTITGNWQRGTTDISGATGATYVLQAADVGQTVRYREHASNSQGAADAYSAATATVTDVPSETQYYNAFGSTMNNSSLQLDTNITVPADAPAGTTDLYIGFYLRNTGYSSFKVNDVDKVPEVGWASTHYVAFAKIGSNLNPSDTVNVKITGGYASLGYVCFALSGYGDTMDYEDTDQEFGTDTNTGDLVVSKAANEAILALGARYNGWSGAPSPNDISLTGTGNTSMTGIVIPAAAGALTDAAFAATQSAAVNQKFAAACKIGALS